MNRRYELVHWLGFQFQPRQPRSWCCALKRQNPSARGAWGVLCQGIADEAQSHFAYQPTGPASGSRSSSAGMNRIKFVGFACHCFHSGSHLSAFAHPGAAGSIAGKSCHASFLQAGLCYLTTNTQPLQKQKTAMRSFGLERGKYLFFLAVDKSDDLAHDAAAEGQHAHHKDQTSNDGDRFTQRVKPLHTCHA